MSQPSLSQQILKLEDELGAKLFIRRGHLVELTPYGEAFLPRIDAILEQLQDAQQDISEMAHAEQRKVRLGAIPTIAPFLLPEVLADFLKHNPSIALEVKEEGSGVLVEALREGLIDVAIMPTPISDKDLSWFELVREKLFAIVCDNHPLRNESHVTLQQLSGAPFLILKDGHCFREDTLAAFRKAHVEPKIVFESGCFLTILNMVKAGMGISVMPELAMEEGSGCKFIPIKTEQPIRTISLVYLEDGNPSQAQEILTEFLKDRFRSSSHRKGENLCSDTADRPGSVKKLATVLEKVQTSESNISATST